MTKKFDVVIGNPPYQEDAKGGTGRSEPIYHLFMDAAYEVGRQAVIITPARFLSNAGQTPKAWNMKMLADEHLQVAYFEQDSKRVFPSLVTPIKGGIVVTHRHSGRVMGPIGTFTQSRSLKDIVAKVTDAGEHSLAGVIESKSAYGWTKAMHAEHPGAASLLSANALFILSPRAFTQLDFLFSEEPPVDGAEFCEVFGLVRNKRTSRWVKSAYIRGPESMSTFKVAVPGANGTGIFGEVLSSPLVLGPNVATTQTFITIGSFKLISEAEACLKYVKSKFARTMLGVLKVTQNNARGTWKHVPLQDFTSDSDIDWTKTISEIDQQLYAKYGLSDEEIEFIETHVKPMA